LAQQLYSEGSAWCSSEVALRRKLYMIDAVEDGYRMRRKLKVCLDAADHHQASQTYLEQARALAVAKEKAEKAQKEREKAAALRKAQHMPPPSTPTPKRVQQQSHQQLPPAGSLHTSSSSPALSLSGSNVSPIREVTILSPARLDSPASADARPAGPPSPAPDVIPPVSSPSPGAKDDAAVAAAAAALAAESGISAAGAAAGAPDSASLDETDRLSQLASSLGSALKRVGEGEAEEGGDEGDEDVKGDDADAEKGGASNKAASGTAAGAAPAAKQAEDEDLPESGDAAADRANGVDAVTEASLPSNSPLAGDDWDVVDAASSGNPLSAASSSSSSCGLGGSGASSSSIYTSPFCTLVLPIGTVYGTLEISALSLKFTFNPHAEQQLLQQQMIALEQMAKQHALDHPNGPKFHPPPPKPKPFTLPSLDAWRAKARKDRVWPLSSLVAVYRRRYQLQKTALELFFLNGRNFFLDFGSRAERKTVLRKILAMRPPRLIRLCSRSVGELLSRSRLTEKWVNREISNFEYLMHISTISGRTYNDINQYPVFPWIIAYYPETKVKIVQSNAKGASSAAAAAGAAAAASGSSAGNLGPDVQVQEDMSENLDIEEVIRAGPSHPATRRVFRDLSKPMGALEPSRLEQVLERFSTFFDQSIPPFHYGSHYSNAAIVLFYLMRLEPYASLHVELQSGKFDWSDRLFSSVGQTWKNCLTSLSCYKELTPEFFYLPDFLDNVNGYDLGVKQDGQIVSDCALPTWAHESSAEFVRLNRLALESEYVSENLHHWIDLIFGYKQRGQPAKEAHNLFFHLTYEGAVDIATVKDPVLLEAIKDQISQFGQTPVQLWKRPHPQRQPLHSAKLQRLTLSSTLAQMLEQSDYHHPILRKMLLCKEQPVLCIRSFPNKLYTLTANFVLGLHVWLPDVGSEVEDPAVVGPNNQVRLARRYTLPFTHVLAHTQQLPKANPVLAEAVTFTHDGRLLLEGNNWDDSLRVYQTTPSLHLDALKHRERGGVPLPAGAGIGGVSPYGEMKAVLSQCLISHRARISCLAVGRDEHLLVTGSRDCTLLVWSLDVEQPSSRVTGLFREGQRVVRPVPRHLLRAHEEAVIALALDSDMDLCVSISSRGQVLVHSVRTGAFLMQITVPRVAEVQARMAEARARTIKNATAVALAATNGGQAPHPPALGTTSFNSASAPFPAQSPTHGGDSRPRAGSVLQDPPTLLHLAKLVCFAAEGQLVFYSVVWDAGSKRFVSPQLSACSLNARHWRAHALEEYLQCMCISGDGRLVATGSEDGRLMLRRLHDLKIVQRFEPAGAAITSVAFSAEQDYVFCGTDTGHLLTYAVRSGAA